jgi:formylglycine-generating enzyme
MNWMPTLSVLGAAAVSITGCAQLGGLSDNYTFRDDTGPDSSDSGADSAGGCVEDGGQSGDSCPYVCSDGACVGECTPGATQCKGNTPQSCDTTGQWQDGAACQYVCTAGTCSEGCGSGAKRCDGNVPQTCNADGRWDGGDACTFACSEGSCTGLCVPGVKQCDGLVPQKCDSAGQWQADSTCQYVCVDGDCAGVCQPGSKACNGNLVQTCQAGGQWDSGAACSGASPVCESGQCVTGYGPSCNGLAANCGSGRDRNCCAASAIPGGTFKRGYDGVDYMDGNYPATVSGFVLDVYEVTVGRFRKFVAAYPGNKPAAGAGVNPNNASDPGWDIAWNSTYMPADRTALISRSKCDSTYQTWTDAVGGNETLPMSCTGWYVAYAFCIWDGGRLPTEAEWNYAASAGSEQRAFPWSNPPKSTTINSSYAVYSPAAIGAVGSKSPTGDGKWGQADMAGNLWELVFDAFGPYSNPCVDCANLADTSLRVIRGGDFGNSQSKLLTSSREDYGAPQSTSGSVGFRCVRSSP